MSVNDEYNAAEVAQTLRFVGYQMLALAEATLFYDGDTLREELETQVVTIEGIIEDYLPVPEKDPN